jgi:hypothetical protein
MKVTIQLRSSVVALSGPLSLSPVVVKGIVFRQHHQLL